MKKSISLRLEENLLKELDFYAKELERSRTFLIEKAITSYFDKLDAMIADQRIDRLKSGETQPIELSEVFKKAGINV